MTKILLVEDDKSLREIYGVRLMAEGYDIVSAGDGEEALALAIKERPSLILSDVMMPKISGFDMLDILRSTSETKDIKVIMMTALSSEDQRARGEALGADRYLVKSQVGIEDVVRTVHDVIGDSLAPAPAPPSFPATPTAQPIAVTAEPIAPPQAVAPQQPVFDQVPQPAQPATVVAPQPVQIPTPAPAPQPITQPAQQPIADAYAAPIQPVEPAQPIAPAQPFQTVQPAQQQAPIAQTPDTQSTQPAFQSVAQQAPAPVAPPAPQQPVYTQQPTTQSPMPQPFTPQPQPAPASPLPQPTAPFSTDRPASLGDRIINPLPSAEGLMGANGDISAKINQELSDNNQPNPFQ